MSAATPWRDEQVGGRLLCCGIPGIQRTGKPWAACRTAIARAWKPTKPIIWLIRIISRLVKPTSSSWLRERALMTEGEPAS
jgi:hypothetical protein